MGKVGLGVGDQVMFGSQAFGFGVLCRFWFSSYRILVLFLCACVLEDKGMCYNVYGIEA